MKNKVTIAALKKEIDALKEELKIAKRFITQLPAHVYWLDKNLVFQGSNQAQAEAAGLKSPEELIGTKVSDYLPAQLFEIINENNTQVLRGGKTITVEENGRLDGINTKNIIPYKTFLSCKSPLYDENKKLLGIIGTSVDITSLKEKENQIKREKEQVEITLSHIISLMPGHVYWQNNKGVLNKQIYDREQKQT